MFLSRRNTRPNLPVLTLGSRCFEDSRSERLKSSATLSRVSKPIEVKYWFSSSAVKLEGSVVGPRFGEMTGLSCLYKSDGAALLMRCVKFYLQSALIVFSSLGSNADICNYKHYLCNYKLFGFVKLASAKNAAVRLCFCTRAPSVHEGTVSAQGRGHVAIAPPPPRP